MNELTCGICMNRFGTATHIPQRLSRCNHPTTVCKKCITEPIRIHNTGYFKCPYCSNMYYSLSQIENDRLMLATLDDKENNDNSSSSGTSVCTIHEYPILLEMNVKALNDFKDTVDACNSITVQHIRATISKVKVKLNGIERSCIAQVAAHQEEQFQQVHAHSLDFQAALKSTSDILQQYHDLSNSHTIRTDKYGCPQ
jgi:hypothetical protein